MFPITTICTWFWARIPSFPASSTILQNWAQYMNFGYTDNSPMTIHDAWYLAAHNAYHGHTYTNTMVMAIAADTACTGITLSRASIRSARNVVIRKPASLAQFMARTILSYSSPNSLGDRLFSKPVALAAWGNIPAHESGCTLGSSHKYVAAYGLDLPPLPKTFPPAAVSNLAMECGFTEKDKKIHCRPNDV